MLGLQLTTSDLTLDKWAPSQRMSSGWMEESLAQMLICVSSTSLRHSSRGDTEKMDLERFASSWIESVKSVPSRTAVNPLEKPQGRSLILSMGVVR